MKFARPLLIGTTAFVLTAAVILLVYAASTFEISSLTTASANPTPPAARPTRISTIDKAQVPTETPAPTSPTDTDVPTPEDTATPTEIALLLPPTLPPVSSASFKQGMTLRTDGDYAHAAASFRAAIEEKPDASIAREAQFRLGESLWLSGDYVNAAQELGALLAANGADNLAARAHYFLGDIYTQQRAYAKALEHLRAYRAQTRSLAGEIDAEIGDVMFAAGDSTGAIAQYNVALQDPTLTAAQRIDFLERIADVHSKLGEPSLAAAQLSKAFALAPDTATAADVEYRWGLALDASRQHAAAVTHWRHAIAAYPVEGGAYQALVQLVNANEPVDDFQRGLVDLYAAQYDPAILVLNRFVKANPGQNAAALYNLGRAYQKNGQISLAARMYGTLLSSYPNDKRAPDALYYQAQTLDTTAAVAAYNQFASRYPNDSRADDALWAAARALDVEGRASEARAQYEQLAARYPNSSWAPTALFDIGLDYYLANDKNNAETRWKVVANRYPDTMDADHALFWLGKLAQERGDQAGAQTYLQQAAQPPRSYYSWRALDLLDPLDAKISYNVADYAMTATPDEIAEFEKWLAGWAGATPVSAQLSATVLNDFHFRRGSELAQLDQAGEARLEFQKVYDRFKGDARALYALARYFQDNNFFDLSIQAAGRIQSLSGRTDGQLPRYLRRLIYPTYYADLIVPYAQRNGFDPAVFFALVRQESSYNALAKSWVGAAGLSQVMPSTGLGIARDLGVRNFKQGDLFRPYVSIRFGTFFFGQLVKYFDGNVFYSLAGYNGGPGNAKKWQRPDVDVAVEIIHLSESYTYVRTVYSQYNQYLEIYRGR